METSIKLTTPDAEGREVSTVFCFHLGARKVGLGRPGLSEQLRVAGKM